VLVQHNRAVDRLEGRASAPTIESMLERHLQASVVALGAELAAPRRGRSGSARTAVQHTPSDPAEIGPPKPLATKTGPTLPT
jgi:hypothetical protein